MRQRVTVASRRANRQPATQHLPPQHVIHASLAGVLGQGPRHGAVAFSDLRRVGWLLSLAHGAGGVVLPAFSLGIVMDGGARSGHLVGLAAEG